MPAGTMLDVLGVLDSIGDYTTITLKNGTEQAKRSLVLRDNSNRSIELTMWAEFASEPGDHLSQVRSPQPSQIENAASMHRNGNAQQSSSEGGLSSTVHLWILQRCSRWITLEMQKLYVPNPSWAGRY